MGAPSRVAGRLSPFADWAENAAILGLLGVYPEGAPLLARLSCMFTLVKAAAGITSLAVLACLTLLLGVRWSRTRLARLTDG